MKTISRRHLLAGAAMGTAMLAARHNAQASVPQGQQTGDLDPGTLPMKAYSFDLADVKILPGPFHDNMIRDLNYLLAYDCNRLLASFQKVSRLPTKAPTLGGWDAGGQGGTICGHYLSACSMMYAHTRDHRLLEKIDYLLPRLAECQKANGKIDPRFAGYVAGLPGSIKAFGDALEGKINVGNPHALFTFSLNGMWSPWYSIHKILAGLRDTWLHTGRAQAKEILIGLADWSLQYPAKLSETQMQTMLISEQGGMNEVLADVYCITGDRQYLKGAEAFNEHSQLTPLMHRKDILTGCHSNQYIPRVIGIAREYELTGKDQYRAGAEFFWENVARHRTFVFGGNSNREYFFQLGDAWQNLSVGSAETCCTYNILKLTEHYFSWNATMEAADFFERGLVNHILGSQDPATGMMTYYMSMRPGHFKTFNTPWDSCWCCMSTGMENHAKYSRGVYYHKDDTLWINVYLASELDWKGRGMKVRQTTRFPDEGRVRIEVTCEQPIAAHIKLRHPYWSTPAMDITLNGKALNPGSPNSYLDINRTWQTGDVLEIELKMPLRIERMAHHPSTFAIFSGPRVLAATLGNALMLPPVPYANGNQYEWASVPDPEVVPQLVVGDRPVEEWVKPDAFEPLVWHTQGVGRPHDVKLVPFYKVAHERYAVYFNPVTQAQWLRERQAAAERKKMDRMVKDHTVDRFIVGNAASMTAHHLRDEVNVDQGSAPEGRWIDAHDGGGFTFNLKVVPDTPMALACTWWGSDSGGRKFHILVDGHVIATQVLNNIDPGQLKTVLYDIPRHLTQGKKQISVRLQAEPGMFAGGMFDCRAVKLH
jgi:DUF1680 family protein